MGQIFFEGFFLQAGLIFALGAQNMYVLESGLKQRHHIAVSFVCFLCDLTIIMLGVMGMAVVLESYPQVKIIFGVMGIGFMFHHGFKKLRMKDFEVLTEEFSKGPGTLGKSLLGALTFSVINPHAYLDGVVLIGGYASKYPDMDGRLLVGLGAASYSLVWFLLLSNASSTMLPLLKKPRNMKTAMSVCGIILLVLSFRLSFDVYDWVLEIYGADSTIVLKR